MKIFYGGGELFIPANIIAKEDKTKNQTFLKYIFLEKVKNIVILDKKGVTIESFVKDIGIPIVILILSVFIINFLLFFIKDYIIH